MPLRVRVEAGGTVRFGDDFAVSFQRTLRVPEGVGRLPPGLGPLPVLAVEDFADRVPAAWRARGGVFLPLHPREALWLGFLPASGLPHAVKVGVGTVNAVTGEPWEAALRPGGQDYLVCPPQLWLDGIRTATGEVRQFVAAPLGRGLTVEGQVTGEERAGGLQLVVFAPRPERLPPPPPPAPGPEAGGPVPAGAPGGPGPGLGAPPELGIAAGGRIEQKIYPDPYGPGTWDPGRSGELWVHLLNAGQFRAVTGRDPPPTPVSARTYTEHGFPWFELLDEEAGDVAGSGALERVRPLSELERGAGDAAEEPFELPPEQVVRLRPDDGGGGTARRG